MKKLDSIEDLKYGKLNLEDIEFIEKPRPAIDEILWNFLSESYPDKEQSMSEIKEIKQYQSLYSKNKFKLDFCKDADEDLHHTLSNLLFSSDERSKRA